MIQISENQLDALRHSMKLSLRNQLVKQIRRDHSDKCQGRNEAALLVYVDSVLEFAQMVRIERIPTIQRLVNVHMRYGFHRDLNLTLRYPLEQFALDESVRLDNFEHALAGKFPLKVIDLDSPLEFTQGLA